jgi:hypothetical protein
MKARRSVGVEHGQHVGVAHAAHRLGLAQEPGALGRVRELGQDDLERDLAIDLGIVRSVHDAHRSLADPVDHDVATDGECRCAWIGRGRRLEELQRAGDGPAARWARLEVVKQRLALGSGDRPVDQVDQRVVVQAGHACARPTIYSGR